MRLGKEAMEALQAEVTGRLLPGDELVVAGPVGLKGTSVIAEVKEQELLKYFSLGFLNSGKNLFENYRVDKEKQSAGDMALQFGATSLYAIGEGGFLSALWKMAEASEVGLSVDLRKVPIRQETIEICEIFDVNPYRLLGTGAFLIGISNGEELASRFRRMGWMAEVIGQTDCGKGRLLYSRENARYLDRPGEDEIKGVIKTWQN